MASLSRILRRSLSTLSPTIQSKPLSVRPQTTDVYRERDLLKVVQKFKKSSEIDRFRTKNGVYENTVRRLSLAKKVIWIEEIIEDQKKYKDITKEGFTVRLISLYGKSGMFDHAQKLFDEMPELKCDRSVLSVNALLGAAVNSKKFDKIDELFRELPGKLSIEPDLVSYNVVIKGLCEMGASDSAFSMLEEMEKKGFEPDLITFNTYFHGLYPKKGKFSEGEKIWDLMKNKNVVPDVRSYNSKLVGLGLEKRTLEAVELLATMEENGTKPDMYSIDAVIQGFCNEENYHEAKKWYGELITRGFAPNKYTFEKLIPFICKKGDVDFAFGLFKDVFKHKCLVKKDLLQLVVDALVKASKIEEAKELVELGKSNSYCQYLLQISSDE